MLKPTRKKLRVPDWIVLLFGALMFSVLLAGNIDVMLCAMRLQREGVQTTARVVEVGKGGRRANWVRYHFTVAGDPQTFSATEALRLRRDVAAKVLPRRWEEASRTGTIPIRYVPANPWINLPEDAPLFFSNPWICGVLAAIVGVFAIMFWILFVHEIVRSRLPAPAP